MRKSGKGSVRRPLRRKPPRSARRVAAALILGAIVLLAGLFALHAAATHWLLAGPRLRSWINTTPETSLLDWDEAVSVIPGVVRLKNLRIRGSDDNVEWIIRLADARADYSMPSLLSRTFRVSRVRGTGLSFRLRQKLDRGDATRPPADVLPPIAGFSDPPWRRTTPRVAPNPDPWTIDISGIAIDHFDEIWIDAYRFGGAARLDGEFLLRPGLRARVGPADVKFSGGRLTVGTRPLISALTGNLHARFEEWDPRRVQGGAVWRYLGAQIELHGPHEGLEFLNYFLRRSEEPRFSGGRGILSVATSIERGIASGRVHLAATQATARMKKSELTGDARASLHVARWNLEENVLDLSGSSLALSRVAASADTQEREWWGRFELPEALLHDGLRGKVRTQCLDARPLLAALGVGLPKWTGGLGTLESLSAQAEIELASATTRVRGLDARGGKYHVLGEYERRETTQRGAFLIEGGLLTVGVGLDGGPSLHLFAPRRWFVRTKAAF